MRQLRRRLILAAAAIVTAGMTTVTNLPSQAHAAGPPLVSDPAAYVNPFIGTGSGGKVVGDVDTFPGATVPFGMLTFSPDTTNRTDGGGYSYGSDRTMGLSLTHISGPGCGAFGNFPILPTSGALPADPGAATQSFSHSAESASPGYYSADLGSPAIHTQVTATTRTGMADFGFPAGATGNVLFKVAASQAGDTNSSVQVIGNNQVVGQTSSGHFCSSPDTYPVYFAARFNRPFSANGTWQLGAVGGSNVFSQPTGQLPWGGPFNAGPGSSSATLASANGGSAEQWTQSTVTPQTWIQVTPQGLSSGNLYQASVTLQAGSTGGTAPVFLDFYNGCVDLASQSIVPTSTPQTLTISGTVGCSRSPQFQVRTAGAGSVDLLASNASLYRESTTVSPGSTSAAGSDSGAYTSFETSTGSDVQMQVGISYVSVAKAMANLVAEQGSAFDFQSIRSQARAAWDQRLRAISISGGSTDQVTEFYTALYHSLLDPSVFSDADGSYLGFDGAVHRLSPGQQDQYANFSGWDVYRSEIQLLSWAASAQTGDMMQSLVNDAAQGGWLPKWPLADDYTGVMNGDAADAMIADAYAMGVRNFDVNGALNAMTKGASVVPASNQLGHGWYEERPQLQQYLRLGYTPNTEQTSISPVPNGASQTLEYVLADFGIAEMAQGMGQNSTYQAYVKRAQNWENLFNPANGYLQPRDGQGQFPSGDPLTAGTCPGCFGQSGFQEGNVTQYNWAVPQNLGALFSLMGGPSQVIPRLDAFFSQLNAGPDQPHYWAGNEIDLNAPWVYDYLGAPAKTQALVRRITTTLYSNTPGGEPGNDDLGAMSSWLVWADLGLYPETAGAPVLVTGSPLFAKTMFHLPGGRTLIINGANAGAGNPYVTSLSVNGVATQRTSVSATDLLASDTSLSFSLSSSPSSWGTAPDDAPPSYSTGEQPAVVVPTGQVDVAPGGSSPVTLNADNATGKPLTLQWSVSVPAGSGLSASPTTGSATLPATGTGSAGFSVSAAADAAQTYDILTVHLSADGSPLPDESITVLVAPSGSLATAFDNAGISSDSDQAAANFDGTGYSYSAQALAAQGYAPGATVSAGGVTYTWPNAPAGYPDNVVASAQTISVSAAAGASRLGLLGASTNGPLQGMLTLTYSDGSTSTASLGLSDWTLNGGSASPSYGNSIAASIGYRNCTCGSSQTVGTNVFAALVALDPSRTLVSITLPSAASGGQLHIFAISAG